MGWKSKPDGSTLFGDRLKKERIRRGMSVREFAVAVDCSISQITGAENRDVEPRLRNVIKMAQVLDCSIDYLCGLED
jgi:transcriptional regulator with XRE-family HTH domain